MTETTKTSFVPTYEPGPDATVELKNAKLVDVENGDYFGPSVSVVLRGGRIEMMPGIYGENVEYNADYTIDLSGKTIMPALFNTHCHMTLGSPTMVPDFKDLRLTKKHVDRQIVKTMAECLAHGITNIRDAMAEDLRVQDDVNNRIATNQIPGPRIQKAVLVGPPGSYLAEKHTRIMKTMRSIMGLPTVAHTDPAAGTIEFPINADAQQVRDTVDRAIDERGAEVIKIGEQLEDMMTFKPDLIIMKQEQLEALADQARKRGLQTTIHQISAATFRRAVRAGVSSLAHIPLDEKLIQQDIDDFISAGAIIEPTLTVAYDLAWKIEGDPFFETDGMGLLSHFRSKICTFEDLAQDFYIKEFHGSLRRSMKKLSSGKIKALKIIDLGRMMQFYSRYVTNGFENFCALYKNGATIALGNDGGIAPGTPAMMGLELRLFDLILDKLANLGKLEGMEAIRIATINSARSMGLEREFGTIEVGKIGDLVVVDGDPIADASLVGTRVAALFKEGRLVINNCGLDVRKND